MRYSQQLKTLRLKLLFSQDVLRTTPPELSPLSFNHLKFRSGKNTSVLPEFALIQSASVFFTIIESPIRSVKNQGCIVSVLA